MKNSYQLEGQIEAKYDKILNYDKQEIDNRDKYHPVKLLYLDRIRTIISIIQRKFPEPGIIRIGDFACAQGNVGLILAELGYQVFAVDTNQTYIEYSKKKYERGKIEWIVGNVDNLDCPDGVLDVAIVGELIEHCAYPEEVIGKIMRHVRSGGLLILTTPNGARINAGLPTFSQVLSKETRKSFEARQFGPGGEDHLFLFKLDEVKYVVPSNAKIVERGYLGGTILVNKYSYHFLKLFPIRLVESLIRKLARVPVINSKTFGNIYAILVKESAKRAPENRCGSTSAIFSAKENSPEIY